MFISMVLINAVGGAINCKLGFPTLGGVMLGFAFAVAYMAFARWRFFGKTWLALEHVIDWAKVEALLNKSPDNIP